MSQQDNSEVNFSLKGNTSIQIGIYFLLGAYCIKTILDGFLIDDNPFGMLSPQILEVLVAILTILCFVLSSFALFFKGKRNAKKQGVLLWNSSTKSAVYKYISSFTILFLTLYFLTKQGRIDSLVPVFLIIYASILFVFKNKDQKNRLIISGICILLAIVCFLIPSYWYSSLFILGVAHSTYGIMVKN